MTIVFSEFIYIGVGLKLEKFSSSTEKKIHHSTGHLSVMMILELNEVDMTSLSEPWTAKFKQGVSVSKLGGTAAKEPITYLLWKIITSREIELISLYQIPSQCRILSEELRSSRCREL